MSFHRVFRCPYRDDITECCRQLPRQWQSCRVPMCSAFDCDNPEIIRLFTLFRKVFGLVWGVVQTSTISSSSSVMATEWPRVCNSVIIFFLTLYPNNFSCTDTVVGRKRVTATMLCGFQLLGTDVLPYRCRVNPTTH